MIRSMTAFGRGEISRGEFVITTELRSVNGRYRDIMLRLPKGLQDLEDEIRSRVAEGISRGRVDVTVQMKREGSETDYELELNLDMARSYIRIFDELSREFGLDRGTRTDQLCQMKDVIVAKPREVDIEEIREALFGVLGQALESLEGMRLIEGKAIEEDFKTRLNLIEDHLRYVEERAPQVVEQYRSRLRERVNQVSPDTELDETRLAQEVVIFGDRSDITEEIVRTKSHLDQFRRYMEMEEAVGRRLDFLVQEINREVNTIGSKAGDAAISIRVVEIKAELEKIREQVQNVE